MHFRHHELGLVSKRITYAFEVIKATVGKMLAFATQLANIVEHVQLTAIQASNLHAAVPRDLDVTTRVLRIRSEQLAGVRELSQVLDVIPTVHQGIVSTGKASMLPTQPLVLPHHLIIGFGHGLALRITNAIHLVGPARQADGVNPFGGLAQTFGQRGHLLSVIPIAQRAKP